MASTADSRKFNGALSLNGAALRKTAPPPPVTHVETPPSPPATETDSEPESPGLQPEVLSPRPFPSELGTASSERGLQRRGGGEDEGCETSAPAVSPITSPPYWMHAYSSPTHQRTTSNLSVDSLPTGGITLQDNESSGADDRNQGCWAKSVEIRDYVTVNGNATNIGSFVVWNIRVETLTGSYLNIRKRYSEFDDLRWRLIRTFPGFEAAVPELPPKSLISKFRPRFLEKRRAGLQYFLNCIMLNPEFSGSPVLKNFLFS